MKSKSVKSVTNQKLAKRTRTASKPRLLKSVEIEQIFKTLEELWPDAHCELDHNNTFQLLIAVVLSAQTTDKAVNKALAPLLKSTPQFSPADLIQMGEKKFLDVIKSIGLAPTKARNSLALAKQLVALHNGSVPLDRASLEALPGVGRKTANVVLNVAAGLPTMAVDTHVARVSVRMGLVSKTDNRLQIEEELLARVPSKWGVIAHHLLIFHGRYHCTARAPKCETCPVFALCKRTGIDSAG